MSFLQEKQSRKYVRFLVIFIIVMFLFSFLISWLHGKESWSVMLDLEERTVSSLLAQGVSPEAISTALKNTSVTEEGILFLQKIGHTETVSPWLFPSIRETAGRFGGFTLFSMVVLGSALLAVSIVFLQKREKLYQEAEAVIIRYTEGKFDSKLPGKKTGTIYQLFHGIDRLATVLKSRNETEHKTKEFLKKTISDISHQLKTPLAALTMYTEIIQNEPENTEVVREFSGKIMQSLERMEELIQSLLKVTRLDAGYIPFEKACYPVQEVIFRASQQFITRAEREGKEMVFRGNRNATCVCDLEWTGEAVGNLIKNALDHTNAGGKIVVEWEASPTMLRISVADDGQGISQEDIYHIFKRFYRSGKSSERVGVGLGLPLSKAIIEGQGGTLTVQSEKGLGTVFTISLLTNL